MAKATETILGIIVAISFSLAGFALKWQFDANAEIRVLKEQIAQIQTDKTTDERQDKEIERIDKMQVKFWRLHNWERAQIDELRFKAGLFPSIWPDLGVQ